MSLQHFKAPLTPDLPKLKALSQRLMKPKVEKLEEEVGNTKQSVNTTFTETRNLFRECNEELKRRVERLERYSRDFNIRVVGVVEQDGEDCLLIIRNFLACKMTLARLRTPTVLEENARKHRGILLSNSITDLLSVCYFVSQRIRKTSKH